VMFFCEKMERDCGTDEATWETIGLPSSQQRCGPITTCRGAGGGTQPSEMVRKKAAGGRRLEFEAAYRSMGSSACARGSKKRSCRSLRKISSTHHCAPKSWGRTARRRVDARNRVGSRRRGRRDCAGVTSARTTARVSAGRGLRGINDDPA
jgi:hypothetical protein